MENQLPIRNDQSQFIEIQKKLALDNKIKGGSSWFFWIAGLSVLNTIIYLAGANITFVVGLGATQVVDALMSTFANGMSQYGFIARIFQFVIDLGFAGFFVFLGIMGRKRKRWAIIVGIIFYSIDAILLIVFKDILGFGFHAFALFSISGSLKSIKELDILEQAGTTESIDSLRQQLPSVPPKQTKTRLILVGLITFVIISAIFIAIFQK